MWFNKPFYKYATGTILILIIIYLLGKIDYFYMAVSKTDYNHLFSDFNSWASLLYFKAGRSFFE